ncbi:hypothetical protein [Corynebacterium doosanense]|uniref:Secreted protein n=1 Tax=Corynebacterium doosanense CAU 212 = DSM 45436 TaxID=558173 RepID=A0A097IJC2_9CORY|nr:hypothetical protein [Corynebacterium doosanense]AIT62219.1 hypothetical protein CDOO_03090 [Corynebacterium doosanense CAU 212 = DSM 45436]
MNISKTRLMSLGLAAAAAGTGLLATSAPASAGTCYYSERTHALVTLGSSHGVVATGECGMIYPGAGLKGEGTTPNAISLGAITLPGGEWIVGFINDFSGLYPVNNGPENFWIER